MGKVNVDAHEYIQANGVRVEARAFETYEEMEWVTLPNNQRIQQNVRRTNNLFSRDENISGKSDFGEGPTRSFPFSVGIPTFRPTRGGAVVEYTVKGVLSVHGRPDATATTQIAFGPPAQQSQMGYPFTPPQVPVGYGAPPVFNPNQGYPQGYAPQGYAPQGYNPVPAYGQPAPGYGAPYQQYPAQQQAASNAPKIRCKFCQSMIDQTAAVCSNCGAHQ